MIRGAMAWWVDGFNRCQAHILFFDVAVGFPLHPSGVIILPVLVTRRSYNRVEPWSTVENIMAPAGSGL